MEPLRLDPNLIQYAVDGAPASEADAIAALATRPLLILMHGYGSFEGDLITLAPQLPREFVCASPRAPFVAPAPIVNGYSWSELPGQLREPGPEDLQENIAYRAAAAVLDWIASLETRVPGGVPHIALMGFSQGGLMVTTLLRVKPERFFAGVNCSGFIAQGEFPGDARLTELRPPLFWGFDLGDPIIPETEVHRADAFLPAHTTLERREYPGIEHSISQEELVDIAAFLERHLPEGATSHT